MYQEYGDPRLSLHYRSSLQDGMDYEIPYHIVGQDYNGAFDANTQPQYGNNNTYQQSQPSQYSGNPGTGMSQSYNNYSSQYGGASFMKAPVEDWRAKWIGFVPEFQDVPRGLQYLIETDTLIIEKIQEDNLDDINSEIVLPYEYRSAYNVFDKKGYQLFYAFEESASCYERFSEKRRTFSIHLTNRSGQKVCTFKRHCRIGAGLCACFFFPCCWDKMSVIHVDATTKSSTPLGRIMESWSPIRRYYKVYSAEHDEIFQLKGHCNCLGCCGTFTDYDIVAGDVVIGKVNKEFVGLHGNKVAVDQNAQPRQFGCNFSPGETVDGKVLLMATAFLLNAMWYEEPKSKTETAGSKKADSKKASERKNTGESDNQKQIQEDPNQTPTQQNSTQASTQKSPNQTSDQTSARQSAMETK